MKNLIPSLKEYVFKNILNILVIIFFIPFISIIIGDNIFSIGHLYTLGMVDIKDFYTFWIALFGVFGVIYNISQNQKRISLQEKSGRNTRFAKGVELLGNAQESARTGGAYSLILLAQEYPDEFKTTVFNILCSHIRTITNTDDYQNKYMDEPSIEIQTLINLLFKDLDQFFSSVVADLSKAFLPGVNLFGADLREANLSCSNLSAADLSWANLSEAYLFQADLCSTELPNSKLIEADLQRANFYGANLFKANLSLAILDGAILADTNLSEANLSGTILDKDNFSDVNIE